MKLKHIIFIVLIIIITLILGSSEVKAATTKFPADKAYSLGQILEFTQSEWLGSYNIFCITPGSTTPIDMKITAIAEFMNDGQLTWYDSSDPLSPSALEMYLYLYVFSTLNDNDEQIKVSKRNNNWESIQQYVIWEMMCPEAKYKEKIKDYMIKNREEIYEKYTEAYAYALFSSSAKQIEHKVDVSEVKLQDNKLGPFTISYNKYTFGLVDESTSYSYGGIKSIELINSKSVSDPPIICYSRGSDNTLIEENPEEFISTDEGYYEGKINIDVEGIDLTRYDSIRVTFDGFINGKIIIGDPVSTTLENGGYQSSFFGEGSESPIVVNKKIKINSLGITLNKTDDEDKALPGAEFTYTTYVNSKGRAIEAMPSETKYYINGSLSSSNKLDSNDILTITDFENVQSYDYAYIVLEETTPPSGYEGLDIKVAIRFEKKDGEWVYNQLGEVNYTSEGKVEYRSLGKDYADLVKYDEAKNILTIVNKELDSLSLDLSKTDMYGNRVGGATFEYAAYTGNADGSGLAYLDATYKVNGSISNPYDSTNWRYAKPEANKDATIKIYDIPQDKDYVYIVLKETTPPSNYKGIDFPVAVKFQRNSDGSWKCVELGEVNVKNIFISKESADFENLVELDKNAKKLIVKNKKLALQIALSKTDMADNKLPGATIAFAAYAGNDSGGYVFLNDAEYNAYNVDNFGTNGEGWKSFKTTAQDSIIEIGNVEDKQYVYVAFSEDEAPKGYLTPGVDTDIALKLKKENDEWKCIGMGKWTYIGGENGFKYTPFGSFETTGASDDSLFVFNKDTNTLQIKNRKAALEFYLSKTDEAGNGIDPATFEFVAYTEDSTGFQYLGDATYKVDGSEAAINVDTSWRKLITKKEGSTLIEIGNVNDKEYVYVAFSEKEAPSGYFKLNYNIAVKFQKENSEWVYKGIGKWEWNNGTGKFEFKTISEDSLVNFDNTTSTLQIKNRKISLEFYLSKTDMGGNELAGATFGYAAYITDEEDKNLKHLNEATYKLNGNESSKDEQNWRILETTGVKATIEIDNISDSNYLYIAFKEKSAPTGYKTLENIVALKFYKVDGNWKNTFSTGILNWDNMTGSFKFIETNDGLVDFNDNTLIIKNENENNSFKFNLKKVDSETNNSLSGATFKVIFQDSWGNTISTNKTVTTNSSGEAEILVDLGEYTGDEVCICLDEKVAPSGYEKLENYIFLYFKKDGDSWEYEKMITNPAASFAGNTVTIKNTPNEELEGDTITGYVYLDGYSGRKDADAPDGKKKGGEPGIEGVIVYLKKGNTTVCRTITDEDGFYTLNGIQRDENYTVQFEYDGVNYEATTPGLGSQADENSGTRTTFNGKFATIEFGKSNGITNLEYFAYGDNDNWNPKYNGRYGWLLKTLNSDQTVISEDFKMTASTTFKLENTYQDHYTEYKYTADCEWNEDEDGEGGSWSCSTSGPSNNGLVWVDEGDSVTNGSHNHNGTWYTYSYYETNYDIYGGTNYNKKYYYYHDTYTSEDKRNEYVNYEMNFGLLKREVDLSLVNDLNTVDVSINGKSTTYNYADVPLGNKNTRVNIGNDNSDVDYDYKLELTENDFYYGTGIYNPGSPVKDEDDYIKTSGYDEDDPLEIYATYRVALNNQSATTAKVNSISYYYDKNYILQEVYTSEGITYSVGDFEIESQYIDSKQYNKIDIKNLEISLTEGEQKYVYIKFKMAETSDNTIARKVYNTIAEITSYSTPNVSIGVGTNQGKVDIDSAPGNAIQGNSLIYEDDTDEAPGLSLEENHEARKISGNVFDDSKKDLEGRYVLADGIADGENGIDDVIVQLIEVKQEADGKHYYIWQQEKTKNGGKYEFNNVIPGNYIVRFIYGNKTNGETANVKKYNGQDYKSTTDLYYTEYKSGEWYNQYHIDAEDKNASVARDNEARRLNIIASTYQIDRDLGEALRDKTNLADTYMYADTSLINMGVAFDNHENDDSTQKDSEKTSNYTSVVGMSNKNSNTDTRQDFHFDFTEVNFGLEERPKTAIRLEKHVKGLRVTAHDGTTIVDAEAKYILNGEIIEFTENSIRQALNAIGASRDERGYWHLETDLEEIIAGATLEIIYEYEVTNVGERDFISTILAQEFENCTNYEVGQKFAKEPVDETKTYNYLLTKTAGEIRDQLSANSYYKDLGKYLGSTYYTGRVGSDVSIVKTFVGKIEDYVNNDLKFVEVKSSDFKENKKAEDADADEYEEYKDKKDEYNILVINENGYTEADTEKINTVVVSKYDIGNTTPESAGGNPIRQTLIVESNGKLTSTGTLTFPSYIAQIKTAYSNPMGRRDTESVPNNLEYISIPENYGLDDVIKDSSNNEFKTYIEPDSYWAETVEITKPTGGNKQLAITLAISITAGIAIVGVGTFAIKKYVL